MKTRLAALAALMTLALCAPASANQWYIQDGPKQERRRLAPGESAEVQTAGTWKLKLKLSRGHQLTATCGETGTELLSNPTKEEATDSTTALALTCNQGVVASPALLPWTAVLASNCQPCLVSRTLSLEVTVGGLDYGIFTGTLSGQVGDFDPPIKDDLDHTYKWRGGGPFDVLSNGTGATLKIGGQESYGADGDHACGEPNDASPQEEEGIGEHRRLAHRLAEGLSGDGDDG
jgi:hypothetical protein